MRILLILTFWLASTLSVMAIGADEMFADPAEEARAREIGRQLRCLVCQNQSIFDSNAALAKDLRVVVRERMEAGDEDGAVLDYIASKYGDYVLLNPRVRGATIVLWAAPLGLLVFAIGTVMLYHRRRLATRSPEKLTEAEREEARRLLAKE
ncbi:cytochrome c-type biogenesis protein [Alisedimentitalea sp. MJ-SS2]|uniref:cytochrome c-type biogenesis protein n=1 Tax=Aliisedimentitalea sp. MJ-SS2 TaxID=3049795 RepID=UPI00290760EE|nr:cytochrome c-type biogenesis protein [Alisedimentitalea sp. MJ-SS2]MDU8929966.1 cytochrome c-type biogenesis protein [Alisedimentitalea sp. MJ-SS2]